MQRRFGSGVDGTQRGMRYRQNICQISRLTELCRSFRRAREPLAIYSQILWLTLWITGNFFSTFLNLNKMFLLLKTHAGEADR